MWLKVLVGAICALGCGLTGCRPGARRAVEQGSPVIVEINGVPQRRDAYERFVKSRLADFYQPEGGDELRSRLLGEFVRRELIVGEAQRQGLYATEQEILRAVEEQHQQTSAEGSGQPPASLGSRERVEEIANDLLTLKYHQREVLKDLGVP